MKRGARGQRSSRSPPEAMAKKRCTHRRTSVCFGAVSISFHVFWSLDPHLFDLFRQAELDSGEVMPSAPGSNFLSDSWQHSFESSLVLSISVLFLAVPGSSGQFLRSCLASLCHGNRTNRPRSAFRTARRAQRLSSLRPLRPNRPSAADPSASCVNSNRPNGRCGC